MPLKHHIDNTLRMNPGPTPGFKMLQSSLVITIPLLIGYFRGELFVSMFGSLMGLVYYLNDHFDHNWTRLKHLFATFIFLMISLIIGAYSIGNDLFILITLFILSFLVGKSKDYGIELERLMLFITLQFLTASAETIVRLELISLLIYSAIAFLNYLLCAYIIFLFTKHEFNPSASKRATIKKIVAQNKGLKFPFLCAFSAVLGYMLAQYFKFAHANWIIGTTLIVMLPDSYQSIYKSAQRILGTILGVLIAAFILNYVHNQLLLILFVFICSFLMPHGLTKNYWVANVYIAALILFFLEIAAPQSIALHQLAFWRIIDIVVGASLGILGALWIKPEIIKDSIRSIHNNKKGPL